MHITGGSCHKYHFCRDKTTRVCHDKHIFVKTNTCLSRQNYTCLSQAYFCQDKHLFVATKLHVFVATSILLSRKTHFCRDKTRLLSRQKYAGRHKTFVTTNTRQHFCRDNAQAYFCRDKRLVCRDKHVFVATKKKKKKKLVAAPALSIHSFTAPAVVSRFGLAVRR